MEILHQLNPQQREAVEHIDGPVMVVAGPGTGKTQILASRIAYILEKTDSGAQNILCLTYTDAGALAMRKRLVSLIGSDAHRVSIHTFHGFCNRVIQENQSYFNYKSLDPITDLERIEYLTEISKGLDDDHALKKMKGNVGHLVTSLSRLFDWMKMENIRPKEMDNLIAKRKTEMREGDEFRYKRKYKEFNAGDLNLRKLEEAEAKLVDLSAAAHLFDVYQNVMADNNKYDYTDMILWVIDLFEKHPLALAQYQELFHYILVDEYQDTSGSQNAILRLLISYWEKPNVFVVGDDDQSIYRFQGAEIKNVVDFVDTYSTHLKSVMLTTNYRSKQPILNAAKAIIDLNHERLVNLTELLDKKLVSHKDPTNDGDLVQLVSLDNEYAQAYWIANDIQQKIKQGEKPEDFAIIYAKHVQGELISQLLKHHNIPVFLKKSDNILESKSVQEVLTMLTYLSSELQFPFSGEFQLYELLHFKHFGLPPLNLARLSHYYNKNRQTYPNWRSLLAKLDQINPSDIGLTQTERNAIFDIGKILEDLIVIAANESTYQVVSKLVYLLNLSEVALDSNHFAFELESIISFLNFTEQEAKSQSNLSPIQFLEKVNLMQHHRLSIGKEHVVYDKNGVNLLTAHASKGLEFKHVYVIHCIESVWEKRRKKSLPFGLQQIFSTDPSETVLEEIRRLFYVAMTRAEDSLTLTYFNKDKSGKDIARSAFIDELERNPGCIAINPELDAAALLQSMNVVFAQPNLETIDILDAPFLDEYLQSYKLSASHLNNYIECPTKFYFQNILRVPSIKNVYMSFGTAIHNSLDQIIKLMNEASPEFTSAKLIELYEFYLKKERPVFNEKDFDGFLILGKNILSEYFAAKSASWQTIEKVDTEVMVDRVEVDGVPIKGQLDRVETTGKTVHVIDYKTGDAKNGLRKMKPPLENAGPDDSIEKRYGGTYWRQIMFYSLLINNDTTRDHTMITGAMDFVEPIGPSEFISQSISISPEYEAAIKQQVKEVYSKIQNRDFLDGCKSPDCYWCNFTAKHYQGKKNNSKN